ncbi:MAG TPA: SRPBCC family protein [Agriterribacter sp.]|nr:SRPBCC family protein [Agriterribacter sp.]
MKYLVLSSKIVTMHITHTMLTTASPEKIWNIWTDVKNWKQWDVNLRGARLKGSFQTNVHGVLIPEKGPKANFKVTSCTPNFSYTVTTKLPLSQIHIHRFIGYHNMKTTFTHELWFEGPLGWMWWKLFGRKVSGNFSQTMEKVKQLAENVA